MAGKVYISFLGTSNYVEFVYKIDGKESSPTRFIQEALVEKYCKDWGEGDAILIFATATAKKRNWQDNGHRGETNPLYNQGLDSRLKTLNLNPSLRIECIKIDEVEDESDIWNLFATVNKEIKDNHYLKIYFDITHAFRFIPMFAMSLFNYSQFVNGTEVVSVKYAKLDSMDNPSEIRETPLKNREIQTVLDLTSLVRLQDWTFAAGQYLNAGSVKKLIEIKDKNIIKSQTLNDIIDLLNIVIKERQTCRGINIHNSDNLYQLKDKLANYFDNNTTTTTSDEPLVGILEKVGDSLVDFDDTKNVMNGFYAAKWCCNNGLYQQTITMLRENYITFFCEKYDLNITSERDRYVVELALNQRCDHISDEKLRIDKRFDSPELVDLKDTILKDNLIQGHGNFLIKTYRDIRNYRNNFNHNGMNEKPIPPDDIENDIKKFVKDSIDIFNKIPLCS